MFAATAFAAPQGYKQGEPEGPGFSVSSEHSKHAKGGHSDDTTIESQVAPSTDAGLSTGSEISSISSVSTDGDVDNSAVSADLNSGLSARTDANAPDGKLERECPEGEIRHVDGSCVTPEITRKVFVFSVPKHARTATVSLPNLPPPRVEHNVLFVRLPEGGAGPDPIVVLPPRQENVIYVLSKQGEQVQRVIEVPAHPASEPEIYFVNYEEGENPTLPGGVDLHTALSSAAEADGRSVGSAGIFGAKTNEKHDIIVGISNSEVQENGNTDSVTLKPGERANNVVSASVENPVVDNASVDINGNERTFVSSAHSGQHFVVSGVNGLYQTP